MSSGSNGIFPYTTAIDSGGVDFDLETGTGTLNLGADAAAKVINVGNTTGVSSLALRNGTGGLFFNKTAGALNATGDLTNALLLGGIVTSTTAAAVTATTATGANLAAAIPDVGDCIHCKIVNTGGNDFTVTAGNASVTIVGDSVVAGDTSRDIIIQKTGAATVSIYM